MTTQSPSNNRKPVQLSHLLKCEQLAEVLSLTKRGIESLTKRRVIPVIKLSHRAVRYDPIAVQAALDRLTVDAVTDKPKKASA